MIARRDRRLLAGAAAGVAAVAAACIVVAGPSGCANFVRIAVGSAGRWNLASMLGFTGLFGSWLGDGGMTHAVAALATLVAVAACAALGSAWRHSPRQLEAALAGATALSLVASPHLLGHDLTLLSPAAAWCLGAATEVDGAALRWPGRAARRVLALWALVNLAAAADLGNGHGAPPGRLVPIALVAAAPGRGGSAPPTPEGEAASVAWSSSRRIRGRSCGRAGRRRRDARGSRRSRDRRAAPTAGSGRDARAGPCRVR